MHKSWKQSFIAPNVQKLMEKRKEIGKRARKGPLVLLDHQVHLVHKAPLEYQGYQGSQALTRWVPLGHRALLDPQGHLDHKVHLDHRDIQVGRIEGNTKRHSQLWCIFRVKRPLSK